MFGKTEKYLYEKEIKRLRKENEKLKKRCEVAEKYQNEYKELCDKWKKIMKDNEKYREKIDLFTNELEEYKKELERK